MAEAVLDQFLELLESETGKRTVPVIMAQLDAARSTLKTRPAFHAEVSSKVQAVGEGILQAGIEAVKRKGGR